MKRRKKKLRDVEPGEWVNAHWLMLPPTEAFPEGKLGEPHGPSGSTMRPWSFKDCGLAADSEVTVGPPPSWSDKK